MKIIAWLIVICVVLLALRIINLRNARVRRASEAASGASARGGGRNAAAPMVRCARCGIYLPRDEAREVRGGYACIGGECASHA
jgi:uncharacterized protein